MRRNVFQVLTWGGCLLFSAALPTQGAVISIADIFVIEGTASVDIPVTVVGGDAVTDMVLFVQVGNGGTVTSNPPVPPVTAFDFTGSLWEAAPGGFTTSSAFPPPNEIPDVGLNLDVSGETVAATGTLVNLTLDTSGMSGGESYTLSLATTFGDVTDLQGPSGQLNAELVGGSVTMVPELAWFGGSGKWSDPGNDNWTAVPGIDQNLAPTANNAMTIDVTGSVVTVADDFNSAATLTVGDNNTSKLIIADTKTLDVTGNVTIGASGTLSGSGTISTGGSIVIYGILSAGDGGIGTLTFGNGEIALVGTYAAEVVVPEPGTTAMLLGGLAGLVVLGWRRRR